MENINIKIFGAGLFSLAFSTALVSGNAWAACATVPNCATLGYVMDPSKCDGPKLFCPSDVSKVYCKEKLNCSSIPGSVTSVPAGKYCTKAVVGGINCYTNCTTCDAGYQPDYAGTGCDKVTPSTSTCEDFGFQSILPECYDCPSVTASLSDGTTISCYDTLSNCTKRNPCGGGGATTPVMTETECRAKYKPDNRCRDGFGCACDCRWPTGMRENNPECMDYSGMQDCWCASGS